MNVIFKFLLWMMSTITPNQFKAYTGKLFYDGKKAQRNHTASANKLDNDNYWSALIGKRVIGYTNEWEDPIVGYLVGMETDSIPIIHDLLRNEVVVTGGKVFPYKNSRLKALVNMSPIDRWDLSVCHRNYVGYNGTIMNVRDVPLKSYDQINTVLKRVGFDLCGDYVEFRDLHDKYTKTNATSKEKS